VPEVHPLTGKGFCEREDEGHVFKVLLFYLVDLFNISILPKASDKVALKTYNWKDFWRQYMMCHLV